MKKFVQSVEPSAIPASGLDEAAIAQANLSTEKDIKDLLGDSDEIKDCVTGDGRDDKSH